jgi:hypothetical protein
LGVASGENDPSSDVAAGLSELECKLRDLERAFTTLGVEYDGQPVEPPDTHLAPLPGPPATPSDAATPGAPPAPPPDPPAPAAALDVQNRIDDLTRSQERLSATVETLMADVSKLVDGLAGPPAAPNDPAPRDVVQPPPPAAAAPPPPPAPAPDPHPAPPPSAVVHPLPLRPMPEEPTPPPPARSVRDYAPNPPPRPGAGDDAG